MVRKRKSIRAGQVPPLDDVEPQGYAAARAVTFSSSAPSSASAAMGVFASNHESRSTFSSVSQPSSHQKSTRTSHSPNSGRLPSAGNQNFSFEDEFDRVFDLNSFDSTLVWKSPNTHSNHDLDVDANADITINVDMVPLPGSPNSRRLDASVEGPQKNSTDSATSRRHPSRRSHQGNHDHPPIPLSRDDCAKKKHSRSHTTPSQLEGRNADEDAESSHEEDLEDDPLVLTATAAQRRRREMKRMRKQQARAAAAEAEALAASALTLSRTPNRRRRHSNQNDSFSPSNDAFNNILDPLEMVSSQRESRRSTKSENSAPSLESESEHEFYSDEEEIQPTGSDGEAEFVHAQLRILCPWFLPVFDVRKASEPIVGQKYVDEFMKDRVSQTGWADFDGLVGSEAECTRRSHAEAASALASTLNSTRSRNESLNVPVPAAFDLMEDAIDQDLEESVHRTAWEMSRWTPPHAPPQPSPIIAALDVSIAQKLPCVGK